MALKGCRAAALRHCLSLANFMSDALLDMCNGHYCVAGSEACLRSIAWHVTS